MASPLWDLPLAAVPFAVVDCETTGLRPGWDRVVDLAVVHASGVEQPRIAFESVFNPGRKVAGTEFHGLDDEMLAEAPAFEDVTGPILDALRGRVVVAHNAPFDLRFLRAELARVGVDFAVPHICTMEFLSAAGVAPRLSLDELRARFPLPRAECHAAAIDAQATTMLFLMAAMAVARAGTTRFGELRKLKARFIASLALQPCSSVRTTKGFARPRPPPLPPDQNAAASYFHALRDAVDDLALDSSEIHRLLEIQRAGQIPAERLRGIHAAVFAWALHSVCDDELVSDAESQRIWNLQCGLRLLGWAPGDGL